jgi:D-xylose transport system substrate-binding protein
VPSVLLTPQAITKANVKVPLTDGFLKRSEVCVGKYSALCTKAGI